MVNINDNKRCVNVFNNSNNGNNNNELGNYNNRNKYISHLLGNQVFMYNLLKCKGKGNHAKRSLIL